jgi:hypothetical protein
MARSGFQREGRLLLGGLCSALSYTLLSALLVLWTRSYFVTEEIGSWTRSVENGWLVQRCNGVFSSQGVLSLVRSSRVEIVNSFLQAHGSTVPFDKRGYIYDAPRWPFAARGEIVSPGLSFNWRIGGDVQMNPGAPPWQDSKTYFRTPYWFLVSLLAFLPIRRLWKQIRVWRWRRRNELCVMCPNCGYDLRASTDRCPECGRPIPAGPEPQLRHSPERQRGEHQQLRRPGPADQQGGEQQR